jgi:DNA-directed RNA polymerase specialized sigma24 family protein
VRAHRLEGVSLDRGWDDAPADGSGATAPWEAELARRRHEQDERDRDHRDFLHWALPQVKEERRRVLELTIHGAAIPEIAAELGISADNAYQRRSRGLKDLRTLKEQYDA